jgi:3-methylcrotonyl-CoA carboxylase alpha subunit
MEMNTRLQVEHPVTEAITGLDLVEWQFHAAAGEALPLRQEQIALQGHAVEARLYAEDPENGFLPSTGKLRAFEVPGDVRVDTGVVAGSEVTPFYDAMIAKLIAHAPTRQAALGKLASALDRCIVVGPKTNTAFLAALVRAPEFMAENFDTGFIEHRLEALGATPREPDLAAVGQGVASLLRDLMAPLPEIQGEPPHMPSPWDATDGFQLSGARRVEYAVMVDERRLLACATYTTAGIAVEVGGVPAASDGRVIAADGAAFVIRHGRQTVVRFADVAHAQAESGGDGEIRAPMHGKVLALLVAEGDTVSKGQRLAIVEAMKMEHALVAPFDGRVTQVAVGAGAQVAERAVILTIEAVQ